LTGIAGTADFRVKVITALAAGTVYDALHPHHVLSGEFMAKGLLLPLDGLAAKDRDIRMDDFPALLLDTYTWRGKKYGVPIEVNPGAFFFSKDIFTKLGVRTPAEHAKAGRWTWDQFLATAKEVTQGQDDAKTWGWGQGSGRGTGYWGWDPWMPIVWAMGGDMWTKDLTGLALDTKEALAGLQFFADLMLKHQVAPPVDQSKLWDHATGKIAMGTIKPFMVPLYKDYAWTPGMVVRPSGPAGTFTSAGSSMFGIYANTKRQDDAWLWCKWISDAGMKVWLDNGYFTAPPRKSLATYPGWLKSRQPWEDADVWAKSAERTRLPKALPGWDAIIAAFSAEFDQALAGKVTPQQAVEKAKGTVNEIVKREGAA
jgi:multiple sugar transport system substrate-binding protein